MTYFERQLKDKGLRTFLQKEEHNSDLRYALILNSNNEGIVYGNVGSGQFDISLVNNGQIVQYCDDEDEELGWDENIDEWSFITGRNPKVIHEIADMVDILGQSLDGGVIELGEDYLPLFKNNLVFSWGIIKPINYGNTSWDS